LAHGGKHVIGWRLKLFGDTDAAWAEFQRFQQLAAFTQGQTGEITILADEKVEDEIVNAGCFAAEISEPIEVWSAWFIESDDLTINDRAFWKLGKGLNDEWVVVIEGFAPPGK
jgi:hypothetical protein